MVLYVRSLGGLGGVRVKRKLRVAKGMGGFIEKGSREERQGWIQSSLGLVSQRSVS